MGFEREETKLPTRLLPDELEIDLPDARAPHDVDERSFVRAGGDDRGEMAQEHLSHRLGGEILAGQAEAAGAMLDHGDLSAPL
jgi:hypothetical protein